MSDAHRKGNRPLVARVVQTVPVPVILLWLLIVIGLGVVSPSLEEVATQHAVSMTPKQAPAFQAMMHIGRAFHQFDTDSSAMVVLEGQNKLGESAHEFYNRTVSQLKADPAHVQNVQDLWSDPLTAAGSQSADGKAAYVQIFLVGNQGTTVSLQSVAAVRKIVSGVPAPPGVKAYVAGNTVLVADTNVAGRKTMPAMAGVSIAVIFVMFLLTYRSVTTTVLCLVVVGIELFAAQDVTATLGNFDIIGLTPYATSMITMLSIAAATDYMIFLLGRYHEARSSGQDRELAFYTTYQGVVHVILGSGLTIAGACLCLSATRLPYFQTMGLPCAVALLVVVFAALTLAPAVLVVGSKFGLFDPTRELSTRNWRKIGTVVVRWPKPIILVTCVIAVIGVVSLLTYVPNYNDQKYTPAEMPANIAYAAAGRHFSQARMNPELLMVEADHDLRSPSDMLVVDRIAKSVFHLHGIERVQTITRPLGTPIEHSSIPFQISMQNSGTLQTSKFMQDSMAQMLTMSDELSKTIATMQHMYDLMTKLTAVTHDMTISMHTMQDHLEQMRQEMADFDDFWRPIRSYFYWEKHCYDIPICWSLRSIFDMLDGVDILTDDTESMVKDLDKMDGLMPQLVADLPPTIRSMSKMRDFMLSTHSTMAGILAHMQEGAEGTTLMGKYFDEAKNDDSFYLPPEVFQNPDFERGLKMFVTPDGKGVRFIITHQGDPASVDGIKHVAGIKDAVADAIKGTPLEGSNVWLAGTASMYSDMQNGVVLDLLVAGIASLILIFAIMLLITRSVVAALVIVGTVAASLGTACGLSVLIWQDIAGFGLQWIVLPLSGVILLAVGSDYNLLVVSRLKEEIRAGLNTGIIRGMGASGRVVTAAGMVFAFTMASMLVSDLRVVGQLGSTIGLGLLVDTFIVRSFMTPSIAAALGRWFWWPLNVFRTVTKDTSMAKSDPDTERIPQLTSS